MRAVIISSSGDSFAVREKHTDVQVAQLAAAHRVSDVRPGSEVLCLKNASVAHFPAVVSAVGEDGTCTLMKQTSEKRSVGFGRVLEQPDPEVLRDGARVLWSPIASCKSFRPAVISSLIVALEDLAVPADRGLLEPGRRVFYRHADEHTEEEDDSGSEPTEEETTEQRESIRRRSSHCSAATVTDVNDEVVSLDVEVGWGVPFEALKAPIVPLDRHAIVVGTKVRYQYSGGGSDFWPATVTAVHDDGTFNLVEDDNEPHESVGIDRIFSHGGPLERASLRVGSQVQYGLTWIAATVTRVKEDGELPPPAVFFLLVLTRVRSQVRSTSLTRNTPYHSIGCSCPRLRHQSLRLWTVATRPPSAAFAGPAIASPFGRQSSPKCSKEIASGSNQSCSCASCEKQSHSLTSRYLYRIQRRCSARVRARFIRLRRTRRPHRPSRAGRGSLSP